MDYGPRERVYIEEILLACVWRRFPKVILPEDAAE